MLDLVGGYGPSFSYFFFFLMFESSFGSTFLGLSKDLVCACFIIYGILWGCFLDVR